MPDPITIAVDAMGGDNAPDVVVEGTMQFLASDPTATVILCGPQDVVDAAAARNDRIIAYPTTEVIDMAEHPAEAVKRKKDSSIVRACELVRDGNANGFFSAGSTGACLTAATLKMGRIKGVKRPMLATIVPAPGKPVLLGDVGANADCKTEYLVQFAQMGEIYLRNVMGVQNPRIGLLNIGEEDTKGSQFAQEAHAAIRAAVPAFAGNAEGRDILTGEFDCVITDGFTGNVCLKTIEGTAKAVFKLVKGALVSSTKAKLGALLVKGSLKEAAASMSSDTYGGAMLLGVKGACIVGHGSSNAQAVCNGIKLAADVARTGIADTIAEAVAATAKSAPVDATEGGD